VENKAISPEYLDFWEAKILNYQKVIEVIAKKREQGSVVVLAQGVFDVIHTGHLEYLRASKSLGDYLVVGLESDETVAINKFTGLPVHLIKDRLEMIANLEMVDYVFPFEGLVKYGESDDVFIERYIKLNPTGVTVSRHESSLEKKIDQIKRANIDAHVLEDLKTNSSSQLAQEVADRIFRNVYAIIKDRQGDHKDIF